NEMKRLLEQRKAGEISLMDEEIYAKIKPKGKRNNKDRCTRLRKEADNAMNEAAEAKKKEISANEQSKFSIRIPRHYLEKFLNTLGYNLFEFNVDEDFEESNEECDNEQDKYEEELSENDRRLE
ncbi:hypothetical protein RDABS01_016692, partial [Bienertia sinuspersici]